jgi:hypothetical protein
MKKTISTYLFIALLFALAGCKTASNTASKPLSFNLSTGKSYDYDMRYEIDQSMMAQNTKMTLGTLYSVDVLSDSAGIKTLKGTYRNFRMKADMMGIAIDIDTDKPDTSKPDPGNPMAMMSKVFRMIKGATFTMKIDKKGNVLAVTGAEQFRDMIVAYADSMGADEADLQSAREAFSQQFNEEAVKSQFSQIFTIFPDKEVKIGDSWEQVTSTNAPMAAKNTTKYTVKEIEGDMVTLTSKTKMEGTDKSKFDLEGDQEGNLIVNSKTGLVVQAEYNQNMYVKAQGMTIGMKAKGNITGKERL